MEQHCAGMMLLTTGEQEYHCGVSNHKQVAKSNVWHCECALWTGWHHKGTLSATCESDLIEFDAAQFGIITRMHPVAASETKHYAKSFLRGLNASSGKLQVTDLYQTPLIEGMWFRLEREYQLDRRVFNSNPARRAAQKSVFAVSNSAMIIARAGFRVLTGALFKKMRIQSLQENSEDEEEADNSCRDSFFSAFPLGRGSSKG
jgi:hypothetical protein